jgi:hypothetical protein
MSVVAYCNPLVPVEWIAAHGLEPYWLRLRAGETQPWSVTRGICPYAGALIDGAAGIDAEALVLTTTCDQMRYAAALIERRGFYPIFLMNVPSTWQTAAAQRFYRDELERLSRFLLCQGGTLPQSAELSQVMRAYDAARSALQATAAMRSARQLAEAMAELRGPLAAVGGLSRVLWQEATKMGLSPWTKHLTQKSIQAPVGTWEQIAPSCGHSQRSEESGRPASETLRCAQVDRALASSRLPCVDQRQQPFNETDAGVPLALVGGPLMDADFAIFDLLEEIGGRVVLDATEGGQRTLPRPFDPARLAADPFEELADAYFGHIPDVFRRPNQAFYDWLGGTLAERRARGILLRRYVWCDLWHAELQRMKEWSPVPVLEIDVGCGDHGAWSRLRGRIEAFLEVLR